MMGKTQQKMGGVGGESVRTKKERRSAPGTVSDRLPNRGIYVSGPSPLTDYPISYTVSFFG